MWSIIEACEKLEATEIQVFQRANRLLANGKSVPVNDVQLYKEHGIVPKYVSDYLLTQEQMRAIG